MKLSDLTELITAIESWMALNVPSENLNDLDEAFLESAPGSGAKPVIQSTVLIGSARDTVLQNSQELENVLQTPGGLPRFKQNPMDGITSVMNIAREGSGFNPAQISDPGRAAELNRRNKIAYVDYLRRLRSAPFFVAELNDVVPIARQDSNWQGLIAQMAELFVGIDPRDLESIRTSLVDLANTSATYQGSPQSLDLFAQNVLVADGTQNHIVHLYRSEVTMTSTSNKGATSTQTDFQVHRMKFRFKTDQWPSLADSVWNQKVTTVKAWLARNCTEHGHVHATLPCLHPSHSR